MRHFLDPRNMHVFAETLGTIEALGLLRPGEASAEIVAAVERLPPIVIVDRSGLRARLHHSMADTAAATRVRRDEDERAVRAAVVAAVAGNKPAVVVKAAAEGARGCLAIHEAHEIALDQAFRELPQ